MENMNDKTKEQLLKESEEKYRGLYNSIRDSILVADSNRNIIDCNPAFCSLFGYSKNEVIGKQTVYIYENETEFKALGEALKEHFGDTPFLKTVNYKKKSGEIFSGETNVFYLKDDNGKVSGFIGLIRNITERKQTEDALRESEKKYRYFFENNDAIILFVNPKNGKIIFVNNAASNFYGYSKKQLEELNVNDINTLPPEEIRAKMAEAGLKKQNYFVFKHKLANGEIRDVEIYQSKLHINNQDIFSIIVHDITERKQTEVLLMEFKANLNSLINNRNESIWSIDSNYNYIIFNNFFKKAYYATFNIELKKGLNLMDILTPELIEFWKPKYDKALIGERIVFELSNQVADELHFYEVTLNPIISDGKITGVSGLSIDISERKQIEERIIQEKNKAQQYLNIADVMMVSVDSSGIVQLINPKGCEILGYSEEEIVGHNWFDNFLPERIRENVKEVIKKVFSGEMELAKYYENEILTKSGNERIIAWHNAVYKDDNGKIIGTLSSGEDITKRKIAEEGLKKQREQLEELVKERTQEINEKNQKLSDQMKIFVGRELKIRDLENRFRALQGK